MHSFKWNSKKNDYLHMNNSNQTRTSNSDLFISQKKHGQGGRISHKILIQTK